MFAFLRGENQPVLDPRVLIPPSDRTRQEVETVAKAKTKVSKKKTARKAPAKKKATKKVGTKRAAAKKGPKKKVAKKKVATKKKAGAKKTPAKKRAAAKRTPATTKKTAKKKVVKKKAVARKKAVAKKKVVAKKKIVRKKVTAKKRTAKKKAVEAKQPTTKRKPAAKAASKRKSSARTTRQPRIEAAPQLRPRIVRKVVNLQDVKIPADYKPSEKDEYMSPEQLAYFKRKLEGWRDELIVESQETLEHLRTETRDVGDEAERASRESDNILELRTRDRYRKLLRKIEEALKRVEEGAYGYCEETGEEIGLGRLEARPIATLTVDAQERREMFQKQFRDDR